MASVVNTVTIAGSVRPVFDLVTTARFWPQWHPATQAVGGVTQRLYQLGDLIQERGQIAALRFHVTWKVVEHVRPARVVLQCETPPARITYSFRARGEVTEFQREVAYEPAVFASAFPDPSELDTQSQQALDQLKKLVEEILQEEATAI